MSTKTDFQAFGSTVAAWVAERTGEPISASVCAETLATAETIVTASRVPFLISDLWPASRLEVLYVPPEGTQAGPATSASFSGEVSRAVLLAVGQAVRAEFDQTGADMLRIELDNGAALFLHSPEARDTVAKGAGVLLLSE